MNDYSWLIGDAPFDLRHERNYSFTRSAMGCGGIAALAVFPQSIEQLVWVVERLENTGTAYRVLGKTTNVLPFSGRSETVFVFTGGVCETEFSKSAFFATGVSSVKLLNECKNRRLSGAEFLMGIPCSVGGAAYMNAGVAGGYFSSVIESVFVYAKGELKKIGVEECAYSYKKSRFMQSGETILGVFLSLNSATLEEIEEKLERFQQRRKALPKGKSLGCIFKNPAQKSAGALIEGAGLKGLRMGGAVVSPLHANFIINEKNATVEDVCALIKTIKNAVYAQYGVLLEEEIEYLS